VPFPRILGRSPVLAVTQVKCKVSWRRRWAVRWDRQDGDLQAVSTTPFPARASAFVVHRLIT